MGFVRDWDSSCPKVWCRFEIGDTRFVIQDLALDAYEEALQILVEHLCPDETMCSSANLLSDPESVRSISEFWRECLSQRTSLGCYVDFGGNTTLVGLNVCLVQEPEDFNESHVSCRIEGDAWIHVYNTLEYMESKTDVFKYLEVNKVLIGMGLVVRREYRGMNLGCYILSAREPLCRHLGIKATSTVFTGIASQTAAARAGFSTVAEATLKELHDSGLIAYPADENRSMKLMIKKYE